LPLVDQLDDNWLVRILDIENNRFVPDWLRPDPHIGLRVRVVLEHFDQVGGLIQVLGVDDVHLELRVVANTHVGHEVNLSLRSLLQLEFDFVFLAGVVDDVSHYFLLSLQQLVARFNIFQDELVPGSRKKM